MDASHTIQSKVSGDSAVASVAKTSRKVLFLDIDNCLYSASTQILPMMSKKISSYLQNYLGMTPEEADRLHKQYYQEYTVSIEGLLRHHDVDPHHYNLHVDDALPLDEILKPDPKLRDLLEDIDKAKVKLWLLTNAYVTHAKRVVKLLGVEDLFEGITHVEYEGTRVFAKPDKEMFLRAMREAGVKSVADCFFVDDTYKNAQGAHALGWTTAHLVEPPLRPPRTPAADYEIQSLHDIRNIFPGFFKRTRRGSGNAEAEMT